jgi:hypothetical protein
LVYFPHFARLDHEKSGNPGHDPRPKLNSNLKSF